MSLYETDIVAWAEEQVEALRRLARSPTPLSNTVDWENVIEEIESLGRSQRHTVESLVENALAHILKIHSDPNSLSARQWSNEVAAYLQNARGRFTNSMRQQIDVDDLWRNAVRSAGASLRAYDRALATPLPASCPFSLDEVLSAEFADGTMRDLLGARLTRSGLRRK